MKKMERTHMIIIAASKKNAPLYTQPHCPCRVKVACSIIIHPRFLVEFLGVEKVRRSPVAVAFLHKHLAIRNVHHILGDTASRSVTMAVLPRWSGW